VLLGLRRFYLVQAELRTARELGEQLLRLAQDMQDSSLLLEARGALGLPLFWLGEFASARAHLEQGIALYDPQQHRSHAFLYGLDPGVVCLSVAALVLWQLGYPDQALRKIHEALALAQELSHPYSQAYALAHAAQLHQARREGSQTQERAEATITVSTEQGFPYWLTWGTIMRGWALVGQGQREEGIAQIHQGLAADRATGAELARPYHLALLAEAYGKGGQVEEGVHELVEALAIVDKAGERLWEAELYRLKGQLTLAQSRVQGLASSVQKDAEACFQKAIEVACQQSAKSLELRAVMSLSRLWQQQGKLEEARKLLAEIYDWFTEGFDTVDLQEAKGLLEELKN
jgi:predicted ATPase